ncbi:molecular chaperone DnaJ [Persicobacter diffluens]|uniref:Molecular chaperone DnaJ n=1 Tax=Persicobacter diffluens TaxID=981 RepID=A0AAN4VX05_9BACT|nr:hypothetical protein PEDI_10200 [Persicobacter diffluens]
MRIQFESNIFPSTIKPLILMLGLLIFGSQQQANAQYYQGDDYQFSREVIQWVSLGKQYMDNGDFQNANIAFRRALATKEVLPYNMAYLFAETLYEIGQYKNAENFTERYLNMTGNSGDYFRQAAELKTKIDNKLKVILDCNFCNALGYRLKPCQDCDGLGTLEQSCPRCHGIGKERCNACNGQGVQISVNQFGLNDYQSCTKCSNSGFATCSMCEGEKHLNGDCPVCLGSAKVPTNQICDHHAH